MEELMYEKREIVKLIILNNKIKYCEFKIFSLGGTNYAVIEPKEVLAEPIKMNANKNYFIT